MQATEHQGCGPHARMAASGLENGPTDPVVDPECGCLPCCLQDLAAGYMSGKLLLKLDAIAFLLTHHTSGGDLWGQLARKHACIGSASTACRSSAATCLWGATGCCRAGACL